MPLEAYSASRYLHRRPAYAVIGPAILCHQCFRFSDDGNSGDRTDGTEKLNAVLRGIQLAGRPAAGGKVLVFRPSRNDVAADRTGPGVETQETILANLEILNGHPEWKGWRARMRVDVHSEYYSVTFILDQDKSKNRPIDIQDKMDEGAASTFVTKWYDTRWEDFFRLFAKENVSISFPHQQIFECRGLAIASKPHADHDKLIPDARAKDVATNELIAWANKQDCLLTAILTLKRPTSMQDQDANCIVCTALDGRCLYATAMGQAADGQTEAVTPERYLVVHDGVSKFQLGRLLRRFHVLDELRCAAIFDFRELIVASEGLRELGSDIDQRLHTPDHKGDRPSLNAKAMANVQSRLNELTTGAKPGTGKKAIGGLLYRINRSRYYAKDLGQRMTDMLFGRIEGWEPYEIFMHRNLYPIIDHIDSIGHRHDALSNRVARLTNALNLDKLVYIQEIGEIIGWTAFAYYLGQILDKFLPAGFESCVFCGGIDPCKIVHGHLGTAFAFGLALFLCGIFKLRHRVRM